MGTPGDSNPALSMCVSIFQCAFRERKGEEHAVSGSFYLDGGVDDDSAFATFTILLTSGILILVITHDLEWIRSLPADADLAGATRAVVLEIGFVLGVILVYSINLIFSHARNLKLYFGWETSVLASVSMGRLDGRVPVTTNDEFGLIARYTNQMIANLRERTDEIHRTRDVTIMALASLAETRDNETGLHLVRTQNYVCLLAQKLKDRAPFDDVLDAPTIELLFKSAPLHDIGKVGVPDNILLKPGKLSAEEFEVMKEHTVLGRDALLRAEKELGENSFLRLAREIAWTHHEKWDGSGYPRGLAGPEIPVGGRLMALAVYDALVTKRVYKPAFPHKKAFKIITEGSGTHFDPDIVEAFVQCEEAFRKISEKHAD